MQGKDRAIVYAAIEGLSWWKLSKDTRERAKQSREFKDLARRVARSHFSPNGPDADWTYYETMRDYQDSGDYSKSDTKLVPESDPKTFNGYTWQVIRGTTDTTTAAGLAQALALYAERAYKPDLQWSWGNAGLQYDLFTRSTEKRNDADAAAKIDIAIIGLNHLISMVDAFATFRLESHPQANGRTAVGATLKW
jgi:hypothetical protein